MAIEIDLPFRIQAGSVASTTDVNKQVRNHVFSGIGTNKGERVMRGDYGTTIFEHLFDSLDDQVDGLVDADISTAAQQWLPEAAIRNVVLTQDPADGRMEVDVYISVADGPEQVVNIQAPLPAQ